MWARKRYLARLPRSQGIRLRKENERAVPALSFAAHRWRRISSSPRILSYALNLLFPRPFFSFLLSSFRVWSSVCISAAVDPLVVSLRLWLRPARLWPLCVSSRACLVAADSTATTAAAAAIITTRHGRYRRSRGRSSSYRSGRCVPALQPQPVIPS